jgi:perosamine synthetase
VIPQIQPWIDEEELEELRKVIESTFVTESRATEKFEGLLKDYTGAKYAIAVCNGTMGLFIALKVLGIGPGDEVIVPDLTFIASANAVILTGAKPVFCDVDPKTFCILPEKIEEKISSRTKCIMPVHLYGQSADMDRILKIAKRYSLSVVEDAAQGIGVRFLGRHVGTFGEAGVLSFYGNKTITTGEGGVILTNDSTIARDCYRLKNHGRDRKGIFVHDTIGFNFCFTDLQAAIGISQMKKLPRIIARKKEIREKYVEAFRDLSSFLTPAYVDPRVEPVFWFSNFLTENVESLSAFLEKYGIQIRRFFYPLHLQKCYQDPRTGVDTSGDYPNAVNAYKKGFSLPSSAILTGEEQEEVIKRVREFFTTFCA